MLEMEPTDQAGSGRNGSEAVAGAASEAFARWLHHPYVIAAFPLRIPSSVVIVYLVKAELLCILVIACYMYFLRTRVVSYRRVQYDSLYLTKGTQFYSSSHPAIRSFSRGSLQLFTKLTCESS